MKVLQYPNLKIFTKASFSDRIVLETCWSPTSLLAYTYGTLFKMVARHGTLVRVNTCQGTALS